MESFPPSRQNSYFSLCWTILLMYNDYVQIMNMGKINTILPMKCTVVKLTCKAIWQQLPELKIKIPRDPAISFLKNLSQRNICTFTQRFICGHTHTDSLQICLYTKSKKKRETSKQLLISSGKIHQDNRVSIIKQEIGLYVLT